MATEKTHEKMLELIKAGRSAIEYRMLGVSIRPRTMNDADHTEMNALTALLKNYNALMAEYEGKHATICAANDADKGKI